MQHRVPGIHLHWESPLCAFSTGGDHAAGVVLFATITNQDLNFVFQLVLFNPSCSMVTPKSATFCFSGSLAGPVDFFHGGVVANHGGCSDLAADGIALKDQGI